MSQAMSITQLCNNDENNKNQTEKKIPLPAMESIPSQPHFIRRLPLIDSALKAYENSIVKYGADMIDTYAVSPIYDKLGYSHKSQEDEDTIAATTALARTSLQDTEVTHRHKRIEDTREDRKKQRPSTSPHPYSIQRRPRWQQIALDEVDTPLHVTSIKLLDFSGESIRMLKSVSLVFSDTVERAELWLKRLKAVGGTAGH
ncbi:hypothetical protein RMATCC62417_14484 [Rhizopus microsporus]|nr:hypothetical protein RMATCC62417_14484 [Rhizopus microsporus]